MDYQWMEQTVVDSRLTNYGDYRFMALYEVLSQKRLQKICFLLMTTLANVNEGIQIRSISAWKFQNIAASTISCILSISECKITPKRI